MKQIDAKALIADLFANTGKSQENSIFFGKNSYIRLSESKDSYIIFAQADGFLADSGYLLAKRTQKEIAEILSENIPGGGLKVSIRVSWGIMGEVELKK